MSIESFIKFLSVLIIFVIMFTIVYATANYSFFKSVYEENPYDEEEQTITIKGSNGNTEKQIVYKKQSLNGDPFTVLLLGVDTDNLNVGRSDTIILGVVNPKEKKVTLLSIPRDLRMPMAHNGMYDKINHSYNQGPTNTTQTIEEYFNIPIDFYASINMQGFIEAVDEIGGLEIKVEKDISFWDRLTLKQFNLWKGKQTLNGYKALNYARFRGDAEGDFGRNRRQQQVISAFVDQSINIGNISKINNLLGIMKNNFKTNAKISDMLKLSVIVDEFDTNNIESISLKAYPMMINGVSYVEINNEEQERITNELHEKMGFNNH